MNKRRRRGAKNRHQWRRKWCDFMNGQHFGPWVPRRKRRISTVVHGQLSVQHAAGSALPRISLVWEPR